MNSRPLFYNNHSMTEKVLAFKNIVDYPYTEAKMISAFRDIFEKAKEDKDFTEEVFYKCNIYQNISTYFNVNCVLSYNKSNYGHVNVFYILPNDQVTFVTSIRSKVYEEDIENDAHDENILYELEEFFQDIRYSNGSITSIRTLIYQLLDATLDEYNTKMHGTLASYSLVHENRRGLLHISVAQLIETGDEITIGKYEELSELNNSMIKLKLMYKHIYDDQFSLDAFQNTTELISDITLSSSLLNTPDVFIENISWLTDNLTFKLLKYLKLPIGDLILSNYDISQEKIDFCK